MGAELDGKWPSVGTRAFLNRRICCLASSHPTLQGSAYEQEQLSSELSRKYSAAAKALHGQESMAGVAGARSRPVTGAWSNAGVLCYFVFVW